MTQKPSSAQRKVSSEDLTGNLTPRDVQERRQEPLLDADGNEKMNLDMALQRVGGFGLFQTMVTIGLAMLRNAGSPLMALFPLLTLAQRYECRTDPDAEWASCDA